METTKTEREDYTVESSEGDCYDCQDMVRLEISKWTHTLEFTRKKDLDRFIQLLQAHAQLIDLK